MRYFTYYWNQDQFLANVGSLDERGVAPLDYTGGSGFRGRGVGSGDLLYVLTWYEGNLHVLGRMQVDDVLEESAARRRVGEIYSAPEHVVARDASATPFVFDAVVAEALLADITFLAADGSSASVKRNAAGKVEPQTFRNVREISANTAELFDDELGFDPTQSFDGSVERSVYVSVLVRDDDANEVEVALELRCAAGSSVPPRIIEVDHSTGDASLLSDPVRLADLVAAAAANRAAQVGFGFDVDELHAAAARAASDVLLPTEDSS